MTVHLIFTVCPPQSWGDGHQRNHQVCWGGGTDQTHPPNLRGGATVDRGGLAPSQQTNQVWSPNQFFVMVNYSRSERYIAVVDS